MFYHYYNPTEGIVETKAKALAKPSEITITNATSASLAIDPPILAIAPCVPSPPPTSESASKEPSAENVSVNQVTVLLIFSKDMDTPQIIHQTLSSPVVSKP